MRYLTVTVADRDPKRLRRRLALTKRLALLLAVSQADLLPSGRLVAITGHSDGVVWQQTIGLIISGAWPKCSRRSRHA